MTMITIPSNGHAMSAADDDDPTDRFLNTIARLQTVLPLARQIDATVEELMPEQPPRRRRRYVDRVDLALLASLKRLPTGLADRIETAIANVEYDLEQTREAVQEEAQRELEELENRARILRQRLGDTPSPVGTMTATQGVEP